MKYLKELFLREQRKIKIEALQNQVVFTREVKK